MNRASFDVYSERAKVALRKRGAWFLFLPHPIEMVFSKLTCAKTNADLSTTSGKPLEIYVTSTHQRNAGIISMQHAIAYD